MVPQKCLWRRWETNFVSNVTKGQIRDKTGSVNGHRFITPGFKPQPSYVWRMVYLSLCLIDWLNYPWHHLVTELHTKIWVRRFKNVGAYKCLTEKLYIGYLPPMFGFYLQPIKGIWSPDNNFAFNRNGINFIQYIYATKLSIVQRSELRWPSG